MWPRVGLLLVASFLPFIKSQSICSTPNGELAFCSEGSRPDGGGYQLGSRSSRPGSGSSRSGRGISRPGSGPGTGVSQLPDRDTCGFQTPGRILDGQVTAIAEFPWMALLQYRNRSDGKLRFVCGGSLISKKYVLTAAHCVTGQILTAIGPLVSVRLGEWNTDEDIDCLPSKGEQQCYDPPVDVAVEETIPHSEYNDQSIHRYNDIAIVRLSNEVPYTNTIAPICLPTRSDRAAAGDILVVAGWGLNSDASRSSVKLKIKVPVTAQSKCSRTFGRADIIVAQSQVCAGGVRGRDSCSGDSGGSLMNNFSNDSSQWYVEGVVSFGATCQNEDWPVIHTRVNNYIDWIESKVRA